MQKPYGFKLQKQNNIVFTVKKTLQTFQTEKEQNYVHLKIYRIKLFWFRCLKCWSID